MNSFIDLIKRQSETITAFITIVVAVWWLFGDKIDAYVDGRINAKQELLEAKVEASQQVVRDIQNDVNVLKTKADHQERQSDRIERIVERIADHLMGVREEKRGNLHNDEP